MNKLELYLQSILRYDLSDLTASLVRCNDESMKEILLDNIAFIEKTLSLIHQGYRVALISPDGEVFK